MIDSPPPQSPPKPSRRPSTSASRLGLFFATLAVSLVGVFVIQDDPGFGEIRLEDGLSIAMASGTCT